MKKILKLSMVLVGVLGGIEIPAAVLPFSGSPAAAIPDNNASGIAYGFTVATTFSSVSSVTVTLNISGGYNGDLYGYLAHGSALAVLLNRVGVTGGDPNGYADSGFNVTLTPGGADIHNYRTTLGGAPAGGILTGNWGADGRLVSTDVSQPNTLNVFNGADPNGEWTLFLADRSVGSIAILDSWEVDVTVVPEPINVALGIFGILLVAARCARLWKRRSILDFGRP